MKRALSAAAVLCVASFANAQNAHYSNGVTETGQSQFAAIAEIVAVLRDDPKTDWAKVDVNALREHLVDMDNVTTQAQVSQAANDLQTTFTIRGNPVVALSIQRMVLAHSPMLENATGWKVISTKHPKGAEMRVTVTSQKDQEHVNGLGFFGLMTIGAHHQMHHVMIAKGHSPH